VVLFFFLLFFFFFFLFFLFCLFFFYFFFFFFFFLFANGPGGTQSAVMYSCNGPHDTEDPSGAVTVSPAPHTVVIVVALSTERGEGEILESDRELTAGFRARG